MHEDSRAGGNWGLGIFTCIDHIALTYKRSKYDYQTVHNVDDTIVHLANILLSISFNLFVFSALFKFCDNKSLSVTGTFIQSFSILIIKIGWNLGINCSHETCTAIPTDGYTWYTFAFAKELTYLNLTPTNNETFRIISNDRITNINAILDIW